MATKMFIFNTLIRVKCFRPGSNRGPSMCKTDVITTTPRKLGTDIKSFIILDLTLAEMPYHRFAHQIKQTFFAKVCFDGIRDSLFG